MSSKVYGPYSPVLPVDSSSNQENIDNRKQQEEIQKRNEQKELGRQVRERARITDFSPAAELENDPLKIVGLKYPVDMAGRADYQHVMRICIYKQIKSKFTEDTILGGSLSAEDFTKYVNASRVEDMVISTELATGTKIAGAGLQAAAGALVTLATRGAGGFGGTAGAVAGNSLDVVKSLGQAGVINQLDKFITRRSTEEKPCAYITLYMPETMQVVDRHDFDAVSFTEASGLAGLLSAGTPLGTSAGEIPATLGASAGVFGKGAVDAALYSNGYALNPMLEVLYKGTKNREFIFSFKLVPRGADEAEEILAILRTLRFHASPEYDPNSVNSRYFIPPSDFDIEFFIGGERNFSMPRIAKCVLSNIDVNYAPSGQYSTYENGVPTEITCQMTFTETVVLTKEDIKIGY